VTQTNVSPLVVYVDSPDRKKRTNPDRFGADGQESDVYLTITGNHDSGTLGSP